MNIFKKLLALFAVLALFAAPGAVLAATSDTCDAVGANAIMVGGLPLCCTANGTSAASADVLTVAFPTGFVPMEIEFIPDYDATEPRSHLWRYGMPNQSSFNIYGTSTAWTYFSAAGTASLDRETTAYSVIVPIALQINSGNYILRACRF